MSLLGLLLIIILLMAIFGGGWGLRAGYYEPVSLPSVLIFIVVIILIISLTGPVFHYW